MPEPAEILAALRAERAGLRARLESGMGGVEHAEALSAGMDRAIVALWGSSSPDESGVALVALGGYGRGQLSPHSDVDLMVLHAGGPRVAELSQRLFYALWDAGFTVGHATRTVKDSLRLAKDNLEAETSFLEPRMLAGDKALFEEFAEGALRATRKRRERFIAGVVQMMRARHATGGSATSQLEPDLKEGAGGLRDLHALRWFERVDGDLVASGLVSAREAGQLAAAAGLLLRVRAHLHYVTDREADVLLFQHQRPIGLALRYADDGRPAEDEFMRDLFAATRAVEHVVNAAVVELGAGRGKRTLWDAPFGIEDGRVVVIAAPDLPREPHAAIDLFAMGAPPGAAALRWLEGALPAELAWTDRARASFFRLLREASPSALEAADHAGLFGALVPGWDAVRCQPQRNVYHRFTVDAHLFNAVTEAAALERTPDDPFLRDVVADLADPDGLLLACLLHDIGKGADEDHAIRGERMAGEICDRMGIADPRRATIVWLVRHHLLLVEAATRRDLNDENLVVDVAERVGDVHRLRMLYLLSVADGRATGPTAWSPWKAALVTELFTKALHVLERGELAGRDASELARLRSSELREALARHPADVVERHIAGVPRAYILTFPTSTLIRHFALMADELGPAEARAHVGDAGEPGVSEYTLVARDRPGLFSKASGVLALNGVNIVTAQGFTRDDGVAIEIFRCVGAFEQVAAERWAGVTKDMELALAGRLSLDARLAQKRTDYERRVRKGKGGEPRVIVDVGASDFLTVIEVHAPDRVGLLYDITSAMAELSLDIRLAKIATYGEDVVDVFYVRDLVGQKVTEPDHLAEIERSLLHRLAPR